MTPSRRGGVPEIGVVTPLVQGVTNPARLQRSVASLGNRLGRDGDQLSGEVVRVLRSKT
jgi:hypothetical protein